jgi:hypothetical protein
MTYRQKGGSQAALFEYIGHCAVTYLHDPFLRESFSDLSGTAVGMLKLILNYLIPVLLCEPSGV